MEAAAAAVVETRGGRVEARKRRVADSQEGVRFYLGRTL